jgi:DNA/RNA-binding domain of Phe-tRNA-synthetase-like protein
MTFVITEECLDLGLRAVAVCLRDVQVGPRSAALDEEIACETRAVRIRYGAPNTVRSLPEVVAFGDLLRQVGVNPRREQPSVEKLLDYVIKRGDLPRINSLVDAYNLASIRTICSLGAHDLDCFTPPAKLRLLTGSESFTPLGSTDPVGVKAGEYGYVDATGRVLCRLDILQADFSKVTTRTVNALLIVEATALHLHGQLERARDEAIELITRHCGGTVERCG